MKVLFLSLGVGVLGLGGWLIGHSTVDQSRGGIEVSGKKEVKHLPSCGCARCGGVKGGGV